MGVLGIDIVFFAAAGLSCKAASGCDKVLPSFTAEVGQVFGHNALPDERTGKACVEAVARSYGAHHIVDGRCLELVAARRGADCYLPSTRCADKELAVAADIHFIYIARVARGEHHLEVVRAASYYCAQAEVLQDGRLQRLQLVAVIPAEIEVVIDNGI